MPSPYTRQHVVSQVLLERFCDPPGTGPLQVYDCETGHTWPDRPDNVGYVKHLVRIDADETEALWHSVEAMLPAVFAALDERTLLDEPTLLEVVRNIIALHFARSLATKRAIELSLKWAMEESSRRVRDNTYDLKAIFRDLFGLHAAGPEALEVAAERVDASIADDLAEGDHIRDRLVANFHTAKRRLSDAPLEIVEAAEGEFLIGDAPALTVASGRTTVGILGGIPLGHADSLLLPMGPRHVVALGPEPLWVGYDSKKVEFVNRIQLAGAIRFVFYKSPTLTRVVRQNRPAKGSEAGET